MKLRHLGLSLVRAYARVAPTERGGFRLSRAARSLVPRRDWRGTFPTGAGVCLELDLATYPDVAMAAGIYELDTVRLLSRLVKPGMHVVDGGANVGFYTCRFATLTGPQGRVDAFEPDPRNRERLEQNLRLNGLQIKAQVDLSGGSGPPIRLHDTALSETAERLTFHRPAAGTRRNHGESGRFPRGDVATEAYEVQAERLDEAMPEVPDLVKLDLEGSELHALRGATGWLRSERPPVWIVEHNPATDARAGHRPGDVWRVMLEHAARTRCWFIGTRLRPVASPKQLDALPRHGNVLLGSFRP